MRRRFGMQSDTLRDDAVAGLVLGVQSVPDGLATGLLAGVNPLAGLYAYIFGTFVGGLFASSAFMAVQATGAMAMVISDVPAIHEASDPARALFTLSVLTGIVMLAAGLLRLGSVVRFVSNAVMIAFLSAVGVNIVLGQLANFTGYDAHGGSRVARAFDTLIHPGRFDVPTLAVGLSTIALIVVLERTRLGAMALVVAIVATSAAVAVLGADGVAKLSDIVTVPNSLPRPVLPSLGMGLKLIVPALSLAFIGLVQGAGVSASFPNPDGRSPDASRDFVAQGAANVASGLFRGMPVGGSLSATALNRQAGARSRQALLFAGVVMAIVSLTLAGVVGRVAMSALAGLLMLVGYRTIKPQEVLSVWRTGSVQRAVLVTTFTLTMLIPLQYAVLVGVGVSLILHVIRQSNHITLKRWQIGPDDRILELDPPAEVPAGEVVVLQPYGSLFFAAAAAFDAVLPTVTDASRHSVVIVRIRGRDDLGSTVLNVLLRYAQALAAAGSKLVLVSADERVEMQFVANGNHRGHRSGERLSRHRADRICAAPRAPRRSRLGRGAGRGPIDGAIIAARPRASPSCAPMSPDRRIVGPVVATKLLPPPLPGAVVDRPRIRAMFDSPAQVVLVVAPPGYGKTIAVRQWFESLDPTCRSWVTCDVLDENPEVFWRHLLAAIRAAVPSVDDEPAAIFAERGTRDGVFMAALIEQVLRAPQPGVIVLDDVHRIVDRRVVALLELLIERTSGMLRVVVCSRTDPALPIARWRADNRLREVRAADLAFLPDESASYFVNVAGLDLQPSSVESLAGRAEGWVIGLRLMSLMLEGRSDIEAAVREVADHPGLVTDYLVGELLGGLPADLGATAVEISVLDPIDVDLVVAVLDDPEAAERVGRLSAANVFLVLLDPVRGIYRFHPLVRELFEVELRRRDPARHRELHRRAAHLLDERGDVDNAFVHLLAAGDIDEALGLVLALTIDVTDYGGAERVSGWIDRAGATAAVSPSRALDLCASLFLLGRLDEAGEWCERAAAGYADGIGRADALRLHLCRLLLAGGVGDTIAARREAERFVEIAADEPIETPLEQRFPIIAARLALLSGEPDLAAQWLRDARSLVHPVPRTVAVPGIQSWLHYERGEIGAAIECGWASVEAATRLGMHRHHGLCDGLLGLAYGYFMSGELANAQAYTESAVQAVESLGTPTYRVRGGVLAARVMELYESQRRALSGGAARRRPAGRSCRRRGRPARCRAGPCAAALRAH